MRFTVGKKLAGGFGAILVLMLLSAGFSYRKLEQLGHAQEELTQRNLPIVQACWDLRSANNRTLADMYGLVLYDHDPARWATFRQDWDSIEKRINEDLAKVRGFGNTLSAANRDLLQRLETDLAEHRRITSNCSLCKDKKADMSARSN